MEPTAFGRGSFPRRWADAFPDRSSAQVTLAGLDLIPAFRLELPDDIGADNDP